MVLGTWGQRDVTSGRVVTPSDGSWPHGFPKGSTYLACPRVLRPSLCRGFVMSVMTRGGTLAKDGANMRSPSGGDSPSAITCPLRKIEDVSTV